MLELIKLLVVLDETQKAPWCYVHVLPHPGQVNSTHLTHAELERPHHFIETVAVLFSGIYLETFQEVGTHSNKSFFWPRQKPVDIHRAENRREHLGAQRKVWSQVRERQDHVQVVSKSIEKISINVDTVLLRSRIVSQKVGPHLVDGCLLLVLLQKAHHLSGCQHGIHDLQEILVYDILVSEDKRDVLILLACNDVQLFQVLHELYLTVCFGDGDLEQVVPRNECSQAGQRLLATAADSDQHGAATLLTNGSIYAHQVHHCILKQHEIHRLGRVFLVEPRQIFVSFSGHVREGLNRLIHFRRRILVVFSSRWLVSLEVTPPLGRGSAAGQRFSKVLSGKLVDYLVNLGLILLARKLVRKNAGALVPPQRHKLLLVHDHGLRGLQDALEHATELSQVEDVVEPLRCGQQHLLHLGPERDGGCRQVADQCHDAWVDALLGIEASTQNVAVDVVRTGGGGKHHVKEEELGLQPVWNVVPAPARVPHGSHILDVLDLLELPALVAVQEVEAPKLHELARELIGHLVVPLVHQGHRCIIQEHGEKFAPGRTERLSRLALHLPLHGPLQAQRRGGAAEVDPLREHHLQGVLVQEHLGCGSLRRTRRAHHQR
mmetsp:Transcript_82350/g.197523  ORF Transcript_82350/g.197523 Transcript_82350/m.197523 type:complete len:605 (-) Transcript_82350:1612-3426(-)